MSQRISGIFDKLMTMTKRIVDAKILIWISLFIAVLAESCCASKPRFTVVDMINMLVKAVKPSITTSTPSIVSE